MKINKMLNSFRFAFKGILLLLGSENNAKFHAIFGLTAIILGYVLNINNTEWAIIILCISVVLGAEAFNTAIEKLSDFVNPAYDLKIGIIKDLADSGVLFFALGTFKVGILLFLPKILHYF